MTLVVSNAGTPVSRGSAGATWQIEGGVPLTGTVPIAGFKHALVSVLAGAVAIGGRVRIANVPDLDDTRVLCASVRHLGGIARHDRDRALLELDLAGLTGTELPSELSTRVHGTLYLVPAVLARTGQVRAAGFGGCRIGSAAGGARPVGHIVDVLRRFGAQADADGEELVATADRLTGTDIDMRDYMDDPVLMTGPLYSGATKTALIAAMAAQGRSVIHHPYPKPDVTELIASARAAGVRVEQDESSITVHGTGRRVADYAHRLPADGLEALTYLTCSRYLAADDLRLTGMVPGDLTGIAAEVRALAAMGVELHWADDGALVARSGGGPLRAVDVTVASRGIFSDAQPFLTLLLTGADGPARIRDTVWHNRFQYATQLVELGADITVSAGEARVRPARPARAGRTLQASDVRGAAVLVLAALGIAGPTTVHGVAHLDRGYDDLLGKLIKVGAQITPAG
ncbi:hypothetical protein [Micromonospora sp. NPDC047074]|uniref:hypothetical protein n=1 Tax=Micromonospora sp. NPDC047074 TaxID=3154339 RepID=UPI0033C1C69B